LHIFAYLKFAQALQIWKTIQRKNSFDQIVSVFHLADSFRMKLVGELINSPIFQNPSMQKVLADGR